MNSRELLKDLYFGQLPDYLKALRQLTEALSQHEDKIGL